MSQPEPVMPNPSLEKKQQNEKKFHIRNVPKDYDDWRIFNLFRQFGLVDNVHLLQGTNPQQQTAPSSTGFVTMLSYEGAAKVREALKEGNKLFIDNRLHIKVSDIIDDGNTKRQSPQNRDSTKFKRNDSGKQFRPLSSQPVQIKSTAETQTLLKQPVRIPFGELPYVDAVKVLTVKEPSTVPSNRFLFYCVRKSDNGESNVEESEQYQEMEQTILNHVQRTTADARNVKPGQYVIVPHGEAARRCLITQVGAGNDGIRGYLIDVGVEVPLKENCIWKMPESVAAVPALVYECDIAGLIPLENAEDSFSKVRDLLHKISSRATLLLRVIYMNDGVNMVRVTSVFDDGSGDREEADVAETLAAKGRFFYDRDLAAKRVYSRDDIFRYRPEAEKLGVPRCILENFQQLLISPVTPHSTSKENTANMSPRKALAVK